MVKALPLLTIAALAAVLLPLASDAVSFDQLLIADQSDTNLHKHLHDSHGVLRINVSDTIDLKGVRTRALSHLCNCPTLSDDESSFRQVLNSYPKNVQQIKLPDGTVRRTLASATFGFNTHETAAVLELPSWIKDKCGEEAYDSLEELRDIVASVTDAFVEKLDREKKIVEGHVINDRSYRSILSNANHLEHFHVYKKAGEEIVPASAENAMDELDRSVKTFDYHTDAGFFLSFVPAMDCHTYKTDDSSFYLEGEMKPLTFEEDEIVILMGAGAQYWLSAMGETESSFLAASHALRLKPNAHRSWYGKMHLMPLSMQAKVLRFPSSSTNTAKTYGKAFPGLNVENYRVHIPSSPVDGCGTNIMLGSSPIEDMSQSSAALTNRRRLQHVNSPANCDNVTNFFCWYQCIDIPNSEHAQDYVRDGYSLYCLDPSILASSGSSIADAAEPCKGGYTHNSNCMGSWQDTDKSVPGYELLYPKEQTNYPFTTTSGDQYCYGGTSMYMDGFHWFSSVCVIFLFPSWVLSSSFKFGIACFGSILFGVSLECVLYNRRTVYALPAGNRRLVLSALVYGLQLTMGYFIMLLVMTYSGPIFLSCVSGMIIGHVLFNAQDSIIKRYNERRKTNKERMSPRPTNELSSYQNGDDEMIENRGTCCGLGATSSSSKYEAMSLTPTETTMLKTLNPPGATPCCQYTMEDIERDNSFKD